MDNINDIEEQVKSILGNSDLVPSGGYELICGMVKWLMWLIKECGNEKDMLTEEGQGFLFKIDSVRSRLKINSDSEFYNYKTFKDYVLILLTQVLQKFGYIIKIDDTKNKEGRKKVKEEESVEEFILRVHKKSKFNIKSTLKLKQNQAKVNKSQDIAVEKDVTKHWSKGFKQRMIELWQLEYAKKLGDIPENGTVLKMFAPAMYKVGLEEFPDDIKEHSKHKDGRRRTKKEIIDLLYYRYKKWIEIPNVRAKKLGQALPYGDISALDKLPTINIPFTHVLDDNTDSVINNDLEQFDTIVASSSLIEYTVMFKYKLSNKLFSKWVKFSAKYEELNEIQAYLKALEDLLTTIEDINSIKIKYKSIIITPN